MKTIESRSTTSRKKKLPSAFPKRQKVHKRDMTDTEKVKYLERELHFHIMRGDSRFVSNGRREVALRNARKQTRELKSEVVRLNALVIKLAGKL